MKLLKLHCLVFSCLVSIVGSSQGSFGLPKEFESIIRIYKYGNRAYSLADNFISRQRECIALGNDAGYCSKAAEFCGIWDFARNSGFGLPFRTYAKLGVFDAFKPYCGNGVCFQCCFTGSGCHTSFVGFPVINCNYNYGAQASAAGNTVVTDPNPSPGQACLFTPQTCEHLGLCLSGLSPSQIMTINNNPNHIIKSNNAKRERARTFATNSLQFGFTNMMDNLVEGKPISTKPGKVLKAEANDEDLLDLITSRGSRYWSDLLDSIDKNKGYIDGLKIIDTVSKKLIVSATQWNMTRHFFLSNYLSSIPNLYNRMSFTESKIWTNTDKLSYLGDTAKIDSILLNSMHPYALSVLSTNPSLQDYRLLAIPLAGESVNKRFYNGDTIGYAPVFKLDFANNKLSATMIDAGTHISYKPISLLLIWGDGTSTDTTIQLNETKTFAHAYKYAGDYRVAAFAQNTSGLRGLYFKNIKVEQMGTPTSTPSFNKFSLSNLGIGTEFLWTSFNSIFLDVYGEDNRGRHRIGHSKPIENLFRNYVVSDTNFNAYNSNLKAFSKLVIVPRHNTSTGYGYISFSNIRANILVNTRMKDSTINLTLPISSIRLYDKRNNLINRNDLISRSPSGTYKIYLMYDTLLVTRIELLLSDSLLKANYLRPSAITNKDIEGQYYEDRIDRFVKYNGLMTVDTSVSTPQVRLYPNPSRNMLNITRTTNNAGHATLTIYNLNGQLVKSINIQQNQFFLTADIGNLLSGIYLWQYHDETKTEHGKIIKIE